MREAQIFKISLDGSKGRYVFEKHSNTNSSDVLPPPFGSIAQTVLLSTQTESTKRLALHNAAITTAEAYSTRFRATYQPTPITSVLSANVTKAYLCLAALRPDAVVKASIIVILHEILHFFNPY